MTDTRELVELVRFALTFCNAAAGEGLEIDGLSPEDFLMRYSDATGFTDWDRIGHHAADTITALSERCRALEVDRYRLAYAICGGEDFPGLLDGTSVEALVDIARKAAAMHMETIDRVLRAEAALRFYADPENWEPQIVQHETSCSLDDSPCDLDRGGRARAALTSGGRG